MKVVIPIVIGLLVVGCGESSIEKVVKTLDDAKGVKAKIRAEANTEDALASQLAALSPGINEVKVEHDGRLRRLIVTTPKTFSRQNLYPILFCFHGAGGKADGPSKRWSPHAD
jgi:poly(3-hydroxybutyrate) depolymerase